MSGFTTTDRAVLSWVTILCVSRPTDSSHARALRELSDLAEVVDRMDAGVMHPVNAALMELARCWEPGWPPPARCIDYCRLALLDFHMNRLPAAKGARDGDD